MFEGQAVGAFLADGAGSAKNGGKGAEVAVQTALNFFHNWLDAADELDERLGRRLIDEVIAALDAQRCESIKELACTFLGVLALDQRGAVIIHVGDGAIIVDAGDGFVCPTAPQNGEYANSTRFLTDADVQDRAQVLSIDRDVRSFAIMSDGLQNLAIDQTNNEPFTPFIRPFFSAMGSWAKPWSEAEPLDEALQVFLKSEQVNSRTDDDKSLALAMWCQ